MALSSSPPARRVVVTGARGAPGSVVLEELESAEADAVVACVPDPRLRTERMVRSAGAGLVSIDARLGRNGHAPTLVGVRGPEDITNPDRMPAPLRQHRIELAAQAAAIRTPGACRLAAPAVLEQR
jgi:hypothetical protein